MATILMMGAFDTKGLEYAFLRGELLVRGHQVLAVDTGVVGEGNHFPVDVRAEEVAQMGGSTLEALRAAGDAIRRCRARVGVVIGRTTGHRNRFRPIILKGLL